MADGRFGAAVACVVAGAGSVAMAAGGQQRAQRFARAEVAYYAHRLPAGVRGAAGVPGSSVDRECFSAADSHISAGAGPGGVPTNPAWYQRDALNQYCATLRL